jgi:uncharacterized MAPEG superfamily protein
MPDPMSPMIAWLVTTIVLTGLLWVPYILELLIHHGPVNALRDPDGAIAHGHGWAVRAKRAHYNAVENLVLFAPLVLLVHGLRLETPATVAAAGAYFWVRVAHYGVYTLGIPFVRTVLFLAGFACQAVLALRLLSAF